MFVDCSPVKPNNGGSGESASDPINIDCSPVKKSTSNYLAYSGRASDFIRMRTRTSKSFPSDGEEQQSYLREKSIEDSGSEDSDLDTDEEVKLFFNDDKQFPIISLSRGKLEAERILEMLSRDYSFDKKCRKQPIRVQQNALFVIDARFVALEDLPADGNGTYIYNGRDCKTYRRKSNNKWKKISSKRTEISKMSEYHLFREYRYLKDSTDFNQIIFYARDRTGEILNNVALLQYRFSGPEHAIKIVPHGNAKCGVPYTRTKPSVKRLLDENLKSLPTSAAVSKTRKDLGGPMKVLSDADIPRGRTQAYDMKRDRSRATCSQPRRKQLDEMASFNWYAKTEGKGFVRMHELSGEPLILLATDKQLADLSRLCTSPVDYSYLSVDPTFNFGDFSVTPTSYRNILLKNRKTNKSPVFVGPIFIHHSKTKETYSQFFQKLRCLAPHLENLRVFGTDGENALSDALSDSFPGAIHLRCFLHFRKNVESKLASLGVKEHKQYIDEIFGKQEGTVYEMGLLDATSEDMFDAILASLQEPWAKREKNESRTSSFHTWMLQRSQMMKDSMIADVRTRAGLGHPPDKFYTNDSENTNRRLRHKTGDKELGETAFTQAVRELIEDEQETEVVLTMFGGSQLYQFKEPFRKLEIPRDVWFSMNEEQRTKKVMNVYAADIEDLYSLNDNQGVNQTCFVRCDKGNEDPNGVPNELSLTATAMKDALISTLQSNCGKKPNDFCLCEMLFYQLHQLIKVLRRFLFYPNLATRLTL